MRINTLEVIPVQGGPAFTCRQNGGESNTRDPTATSQSVRQVPTRHPQVHRGIHGSRMGENDKIVTRYMDEPEFSSPSTERFTKSKVGRGTLLPCSVAAHYDNHFQNLFEKAFRLRCLLRWADAPAGCFFGGRFEVRCFGVAVMTPALCHFILRPLIRPSHRVVLDPVVRSAFEAPVSDRGIK